jgi:hypothetical protein
MRNEDNSTLLNAHFSDVWAESQRLRSIIFRSLVLKTWRRIFRKAAPAGDRSGSKAHQYQRG